jgi:hypothetical protein
VIGHQFRYQRNQLCELLSGWEQHELFRREVDIDFSLKNLPHFRLPRGQVCIGDRHRAIDANA